jgi:hypothetical protein
MINNLDYPDFSQRSLIRNKIINDTKISLNKNELPIFDILILNDQNCANKKNYKSKQALSISNLLLTYGISTYLYLDIIKYYKKNNLIGEEYFQLLLVNYLLSKILFDDIDEESINNIKDYIDNQKYQSFISVLQKKNNYKEYSKAINSFKLIDIPIIIHGLKYCENLNFRKHLYNFIDKNPLVNVTFAKKYLYNKYTHTSNSVTDFIKNYPNCELGWDIYNFTLYSEKDNISKYDSNSNYVEISTVGISSIYYKTKYLNKKIEEFKLLKKENNFKISFITSIFNGWKWIDNFLLDMVSMDEFETVELILISADSNQNEYKIIKNYTSKFKNIYYIKLDFDPGLYNVWNSGILFSSSDLISNANLDDRKSVNFINYCLRSFKENPNVSLVSFPCYITNFENVRFNEYLIKEKKENQLKFYTSNKYYGFESMYIKSISESGVNITPINIPHCMPVWKKVLHSEYGYFNEKIGGPASDYEFWLRCLSGGEIFYNGQIPMGLYYFSSKTTYSARNESSFPKIYSYYPKLRDQ